MLVRAQPRLLVLPTLGLALQAAVVAVVLGPLWFDLLDHFSRLRLLAGAAVCAYPITFVSTFFNVAYYAQVDGAFRGSPIGVRDSLARARSRLGPIAAWALVTTLVGIALRGLEQLPYAGSLAGRIVAWLLDAAWSLASFFVVPALALDGTGVRLSLRQSVTTIRTRWGEAVTGTVAIGGVGAIVVVPVIVLGVGGYVEHDRHPVAGYGMLAVAVVLGATLAVIQTAVSEAFRVAVYRYTTGDGPAGPFTDSQLTEAFRPRKRGWFSG